MVLFRPKLLVHKLNTTSMQIEIEKTNANEHQISAFSLIDDFAVTGDTTN